MNAYDLKVKECNLTTFYHLWCL